MKTLSWLFVLFAFLSYAAAQTTSSRIAFITPDGQVATVDRAGGEVRVLTEGGQRSQFPAWSPDGSRIAALGADASGGFIQLLEDAESAAPTELYRSGEQPPFYLYWAPDGDSISFLANHPAAGIGLHVVSAEGVDQLLTTGSPFYWQWTEDAQNLLIHTGFSGEGSRLGFIERDRDALAENLEPPGRFQAPGISPSGDFIAYAAINPARGPELVVQANPNTSAESLRRAVEHRGLVALAWSPVRDELAFMSPERNIQSSFGPIQLLDAETGLLETLSENSAVAFFWSPDGRYIAYLTGAPQDDGDVAALEGVQQVAQQPAQRSIQRPAPIALYLIDVAERSERLVATFFPSPQFVTQFLPFFDQYALSHRVWSPASDALVLPVLSADPPSVQVTVIDVDGNQTFLAEGDMPFWSPGSD